MIKQGFAALLLLATALPARAQGACDAPRLAAPLRQAWVGSWTGTHDAPEGQMPLRLVVRTEGGRPAATLDLPGLVYAGQPVPVRAEPEGLRLCLPFGLGNVLLRPGRGQLVSEGGSRVMLRRVPPFAPVTVPVRFGAAGEGPIEGSLILPPGRGPFPAVLIVAGSSAPHRRNWSYASWADWYVRRGIAAFIYDRRPDNALGADGAIFGFDGQAKDLVAALDVIAANPAIDPRRIGVMGSSRGVWIGLALLARDSRPAFFVASGAPGTDPGEQEVQKTEVAMRGAGSSEADIQAALAYLRLYMHVARHTDAWPQFRRYAATLAEAGWARFVPHPQVIGDLDWWRAHVDYDPRPAIARLSVPLFVAWGAGDSVVPPSRNRPVYEALLPPALREVSRIAVYPRADHRIETGDHVDAEGRRHRFGISGPWRRELGAWLHARGIASSPDGPDVLQRPPGA